MASIHPAGAWSNPRTRTPIAPSYQRRLERHGVTRAQYEGGALRGKAQAIRGHRDEIARYVSPYTGRPVSHATIKRAVRKRGEPAPARESLTPASVPAPEPAGRYSDQWWIDQARAEGFTQPQVARYFDTFPRIFRVNAARRYVLWLKPLEYLDEWEQVTAPYPGTVFQKHGYLYGLTQVDIAAMREPYVKGKAGAGAPTTKMLADLYENYIYAYRGGKSAA